MLIKKKYSVRFTKKKKKADWKEGRGEWNKKLFKSCTRKWSVTSDIGPIRVFKQKVGEEIGGNFKIQFQIQ